MVLCVLLFCVNLGGGPPIGLVWADWINVAGFPSPHLFATDTTWAPRLFFFSQGRVGAGRCLSAGGRGGFDLRADLGAHRPLGGRMMASRRLYISAGHACDARPVRAGGRGAGHTAVPRVGRGQGGRGGSHPRWGGGGSPVLSSTAAGGGGDDIPVGLASLGGGGRTPCGQPLGARTPRSRRVNDDLHGAVPSPRPHELAGGEARPHGGVRALARVQVLRE